MNNHVYYVAIEWKDIDKIKQGNFQFNESHEVNTVFGRALVLYENIKEANAPGQPVARVVLRNEPEPVDYIISEDFIENSLEKFEKNNTKVIELWPPNGSDDTQIIVFDTSCIYQISVV